MIFREPETSWRKTPSYQGGFLLDAGVHFTAGVRLLLASSCVGDRGTFINRLSAHTAQLQPHLPPVDTVDATMKTNTGVTGSFNVSFGTTLPDIFEYSIACDHGSVIVAEGSVTVRKVGSEEAETKAFPDEGEGVVQEVEAWAKGIIEGGKNTELKRRQSPEEALADLEVVSATFLKFPFNNMPARVAEEQADALRLVGSHVEKWRERGRVGAIGIARSSRMSRLTQWKDTHLTYQRPESPRQNLEVAVERCPNVDGPTRVIKQPILVDVCGSRH